jgi:hypothetical protein
LDPHAVSFPFPEFQLKNSLAKKENPSKNHQCKKLSPIKLKITRIEPGKGARKISIHSSKDVRYQSSPSTSQTMSFSVEKSENSYKIMLGATQSLLSPTTTWLYDHPNQDQRTYLQDSLPEYLFPTPNDVSLIHTRNESVSPET